MSFIFLLLSFRRLEIIDILISWRQLTMGCGGSRVVVFIMVYHVVFFDLSSSAPPWLCRCRPFLWQHCRYGRIHAIPGVEVLLAVHRAALFRGKLWFLVCTVLMFISFHETFCSFLSSSSPNYCHLVRVAANTPNMIIPVLLYPIKFYIYVIAKSKYKSGQLHIFQYRHHNKKLNWKKIFTNN